MKFKNWNEEEVSLLKEKYRDYTINELSEILHKSASSVQYVMNKLCLIKQPHNRWTDDEVNFIRDNYPNMTVEEISKHINHTVPAINTELKRLGITRSSTWTKEDIKYLSENWQTTSYSAISERLNRTEGAIRAKCFDLGFVKKDFWTKDEEEYLKSVYYNLPTKEIAEIMKRTPDSVHIHASRMGMKKYPYNCNYRFFETIDTEEKAYWLGFLAADGWINKNEQTHSCCVGVELQYGDISHLRKFNKSLNGNYKITDRWRSTGFHDKSNDKKHHMCVLRIFSVAMYDDLFSLGFRSDKSYTYSIPKIPSHLLRHFMRGYFDGDGCFSISFNNNTNKIKNYSCSYVSASETIIKEFETIIHNIGITSTRIDTYQRVGYARMWRIWINDGDNQGRVKFLDYLYKDATIYLDRKYERYKKIKNYIESRGSHQTEMSGSFIL